MNLKTYYNTVSLIFALLAVAHFARIVYGWEAVVGSVELPMWVSIAAIMIATYLSFRGLQFAKKSRR